MNAQCKGRHTAHIQLLYRCLHITVTTRRHSIADYCFSLCASSFLPEHSLSHIFSLAHLKAFDTSPHISILLGEAVSSDTSAHFLYPCITTLGNTFLTKTNQLATLNVRYFNYNKYFPHIGQKKSLQNRFFFSKQVFGD